MSKTIRMDRKQFAIMMLLTPTFAAIVTVLLTFAFLVPLQTKQTDSPLEVPALGEEIEEETKAEEAETEAEAIVTTKTPAANTKVEEKKTTTTKTDTAKTSAKTSTTKTTNTAKKTEKVTETKKDVTSPIKKELCEVRTDGPTTQIIVKLLNSYDRSLFNDLLGYEDSIVDYEKWVAKDGVHAKMVYDGKNCNPERTGDFEKVEDKILETKDLTTYKIEAKTYTIWQ